MKKYLFVIFASILVIPLSVSAHSGKTDSNGCHTNKKTGEYHCHSKIEEGIKLAKTEARTEARNEVKIEVNTISTSKDTPKISIPEIKMEQPTKKDETPIKPIATPEPTAKQKFTCSGKKICADMISCEEAYFQLNTCHLSDLDRDRDGVPCEVICGSNR